MNKWRSSREGANAQTREELADVALLGRSLLQAVSAIAPAERCSILQVAGDVVVPLASAVAAPDRQPPGEPGVAASLETAAARAARADEAVEYDSAFFVPVAAPGLGVLVACVERGPAAGPFTPLQRRALAASVEQVALAWGVASSCRRDLGTLQARLNSPFLHNAFSVIAEMISADPTQAEAAIVMLSRFQRYVVESSSDHIVILAHELEMTVQYLRLEKHRLRDRIQIRIESDGPLEDVHLPSLTLQSLVETAVRVGVERCAERSTLQVQIQVTTADCRLDVRLESALSEAALVQEEPAFQEVKRRLARFYPGGYVLSVRQEPGLALRLVIPRDSPAHNAGARNDSAQVRSVLVLETAFQESTNQKGEGTMPLSKETGLLAFIYDMYTDKKKAEALKTAESATAIMKHYHLTREQQRAVWATGIDPASSSSGWAEVAKGGPVPSGEKLKDRERGDRPTMVALCELLAEELVKEPAFSDAW